MSGLSKSDVLFSFENEICALILEKQITSNNENERIDRVHPYQLGRCRA